MKKFLVFLLITALTASLCACGASESKGKPAGADSSAAEVTTATSAAVSEAQETLDKTVAAYRFEGTVIVAKDGETLCQSATGTADAATGAPVTNDSLFCVGSVAKQFCAAAVLLLQERGLLSIDDKLSRFFPECPYGDQITLRMMLSMRSGIAEFYETAYDGYSLNETPVGSLAQTVTNGGTVEGNRALLQQWLFEQPLVFEPDSQNVYCNSNFFLLARIAEKAAGMKYEDFIRENIFQPLGMTNSGFIDDMIGDPRLAKNAHEAATVYVGITMGLGDLVTDAADMQRWMLSFAGDSLLSAESKKLMTTDPERDGYALGVFPYYGGWYHSGVFTSYLAFDFVLPSQRGGVFAATNNRSAMSGELSEMCASLAENLIIIPSQNN